MPELGQKHAERPAFEQGDAELLFQFADRAGDGGLGPAQEPAGPDNRSGLGHRQKRAQVLRIDHAGNAKAEPR